MNYKEYYGIPDSQINLKKKEYVNDARELFKTPRQTPQAPPDGTVNKRKKIIEVNLKADGEDFTSKLKALPYKVEKFK